MDTKKLIMTKILYLVSVLSLSSVKLRKPNKVTIEEFIQNDNFKMIEEHLYLGQHHAAIDLKSFLI